MGNTIMKRIMMKRSASTTLCAFLTLAAIPAIANAEVAESSLTSWWSWLPWSGSSSKPPQSSPAEKVAEAKPLVFDFGTKTSALAEGFTAVTPDSVWSP